jgi:6-phosphofructokinase
MTKGNIIYGQSGGPSSVINSSALGVILEAMAHKDQIGRIYMMHHGILGAINDDLIDVTDDDPKELQKLDHTAGAFFGNVRYKLMDFHEDKKDYVKIAAVLKKYNISCFFYNGGNDSMDTCDKINRYLMSIGYPCQVIGLPKTIDNDLECTDHTPGYGTSAKFIANAMAEIDLDNASYPQGRVIICEIMGRHAGWLTASSALARVSGYGPDLIYVPEVPFEMDRFMSDVDRIYKQKKRCMIAVSEGIVDDNGAFIFQVGRKTDSFGHFRLGGVASVLANNITSELTYTALPVEFSFLQRAACRISSLQDQKEAEELGREGVKRALAGLSGKMMTIVRLSDHPYKYQIGEADLTACANFEKKMPKEMLDAEHADVTSKFVDYALPLIQGEVENRFENGVISVPHLKGYESH